MTPAHVIITSASRSDLEKQGRVLLRHGFAPLGEPWALGEVWCWTWLEPALPAEVT